MCLTVEHHHRHLYRALEPIAVTKRAYATEDAGVVRTPYQGARLRLETLLQSPITCTIDRWFNSNIYTVERGYHSHRDLDRTLKVTKHADTYYSAIIPEGAYLLIGAANDLVSTHLIILPQGTRTRYKPLFYDGNERARLRSVGSLSSLFGPQDSDSVALTLVKGSVIA